MYKDVQIHPLNAKGSYYVDQNTCLICEDCFHAAPNNFKYDNDSKFGYYVCKQPETTDEEEQCREALANCPTESIFDNGE